MTRCKPHFPSACLAVNLSRNLSLSLDLAGPGHCCVLVFTRLTAGVDAVADIFKRCRDRHAEMAITGAMLFDGEHLAALLCGAGPQVALAADALVTDPRQSHARVLATAADSPVWAGLSWRTGWCEPDALAMFSQTDAPQGKAAIEAWQALMAASDLL